MKYETKGEKVFVTTMLIIFFPFALMGALFDLITKGRTLYINVNRPWEMHLGNKGEKNCES